MSGLTRQFARRDPKPEMIAEVVVPEGAEPRERRVYIATPSGDMVHAMWAMSMTQMVQATLMQPPPNLASVQIGMFGSSILPFSRQILVKTAMESGATDILFIDSDMMFPADIVTRCLAAGKPIVGANCIARRPPYRLTAQIGLEEVPTLPTSTGLERVERIGTGVVFIAMEVFQKMELPWFTFEFMPDKACFRGEDYYFFNKATELGYEIWCDHDLSKLVKHVGQFEFSPLHKAAIDAGTVTSTPPLATAKDSAA